MDAVDRGVVGSDDPGPEDRPGATRYPDLARNVMQTWGPAGARWLADLPGLIRTVASGWELTLAAPYRLSYNWVAPATCADGSAAVLKLGLPGPGHLAREAAALRAFDGRGAIRLLAYDHQRGALLVEHARPGTSAARLVARHDADATAAAIAVLRALHRPPPPGCQLPDLAIEESAFDGHLRDHQDDRPLPRHLVERAGALLRELAATSPPAVVLHGDLHHDNVLAATREPWLAIDPHGYVGDPGYDVGALLYNPQPDRRDDDLLALVPARVEQLADGLHLPIERVVAWGFVKAMLSEVWTAQGGGGTAGGRALDVAVQLAARLR